MLYSAFIDRGIDCQPQIAFILMKTESPDFFSFSIDKESLLSVKMNLPKAKTLAQTVPDLMFPAQLQIDVYKRQLVY